MNKQHFYELAEHAAGQPLTADLYIKGFSRPAELQRELAILEMRNEWGERDFQNFIRFCRICSPSRREEWEWQVNQVLNVWGYPRGVFCVLADNGHPFAECSDELAALFGL